MDKSDQTLISDEKSKREVLPGDQISFNIEYAFAIEYLVFQCCFPDEI